jgi:hypothetical protein
LNQANVKEGKTKDCLRSMIGCQPNIGAIATFIRIQGSTMLKSLEGLIRTPNKLYIW